MPRVPVRNFWGDAGTALSDVIEMVSPEIRIPGWSWVVVFGRVTAAMWSIDHGVQLLVPDRPVNDDSAVFFRYFMQMDAAWLHERLASGEAPNRRRLEEEFAPIARVRPALGLPALPPGPEASALPEPRSMGDDFDGPSRSFNLGSMDAHVYG